LKSNLGYLPLYAVRAKSKSSLRQGTPSSKGLSALG
jgi:hypothetical protein